MNAKMRTVTCAVLAVAMSMMGCVQRLPHYTAKVPTPNDGRYVTFFVLPGQTSGNTEIDRQHKAAIVAALADQGLIETSPEQAEAVVVIHTATPASHSRETLYEGWGGWAWHAAGAHARNSGEAYAVGSVVVDIFDAWTKELLWNGSARDSKSTARLFKDFPSIVHPSPGLPERPMRIIFSSRPATLIRLAGEPKYEDVRGTDLQRVTNAEAFMLRDESGMHYMRIGGRWLEASDLTGSWSLAGMLPEGAEVAFQEYTTQLHPGGLETKPSSGPTQPVYVAIAPAELIITDGEPQYADVAGTPLLRMRNANATVFQEPTDRELYVHLPVGWFRAWTTNGPWQAVTNTGLPADLKGVG